MEIDSTGRERCAISSAGMQLINRANAPAASVVCSKVAVAQRPVPKILAPGSWRPGTGQPRPRRDVNFQEACITCIWRLKQPVCFLEKQRWFSIKSRPSYVDLCPFSRRSYSHALLQPHSQKCGNVIYGGPRGLNTATPVSMGVYSTGGFPTGGCSMEGIPQQINPTRGWAVGRP